MNDVRVDNNNNRPKYLNVLQIRLPITALVSIGHRLSGVLIFLAIPAVIYLLQRSLSDPVSYQGLHSLLANSVAKAGLLLLILAVVYHLLAGIRFLMIDLGVGETVNGARRGAWFVVSSGLFLFFLALVAFL